MTALARQLERAEAAWREALALRDPVAFQRSLGELQIARRAAARAGVAR